MRGREIKEKEGSAIGRYIRNITDIIQKCNDIRIADIMPNRSYIRSTADITTLSEIPNTALTIVNVQKFKMFNME